MELPDAWQRYPYAATQISKLIQTLMAWHQNAKHEKQITLTCTQEPMNLSSSTRRDGDGINQTPAPLEIELLLTQSDHDEIYHTAADFKPAQRKAEHETSRVLSILDELAVEEMRSQSFEKTTAGKDRFQ
jgi:hypothetical protein